MEKNDIKMAKLSELPKYEQNPFIVKLKGRMYLQPRANTILARGQEIVDTTTGEIIQDDVLIGRRKVVDKSQFAKIYASEVGVLFELSKPAINVFLYLSKVMDYNNRAYFNYYKEYEKIGYKANLSCYKGICELIAKNIIALDIRENTYWLNPTIVCKGERFAKYTEYVTSEYVEKEERRKKDLKERIMFEQAVEKRKKIENSPISDKIKEMERKEGIINNNPFRRSEFVCIDNTDIPLSDDNCVEEFENNKTESPDINFPE